jgi:AraC-like DNA-binding protein
MPPAPPTAAAIPPTAPAHTAGAASGTAVPSTAAGAVPAFTESVVVPRFIATAATRGRGDAESLVRAAGLPNVLHDPETSRVPSARTYRLWGAVLARTERSDAGLLAAACYRPGLLDVFDYLLSSAPTAGEGLTRAAAHLHLVSSNSVLTVQEQGDEVTICYDVRHGDPELRGVVAEFALSVLTSQLRHATGTALSPRRIGFTHRAPRRHTGYVAAFGSARVDFEAPADTITLHRRDLERPLATADPALAAIMLRAAAALPPPRFRDVSAVPGLHAVIAAQLPGGRPSLAEAAHRLAISPRTLQRRLGESGTTWRAELDAVRREQADSLCHESTGSDQRAVRLGFAESRSLRRAMSRWDTRERETACEQRESTADPESTAGQEPAVEQSATGRWSPAEPELPAEQTPTAGQEAGTA